MDAATWERHANPLSVYTRYSGLPLLAIGVWSRVWLGWWCLVPIAAAIAWIWINPRLFPKPESTDNWASKSVLGERVWLNRKKIPIPAGHRRAALLLSLCNGAGSLVTAYGLAFIDARLAIAGIILVIVAKTWFLDRMVWLFEDMARERPEYAGWLH